MIFERKLKQENRLSRFVLLENKTPNLMSFVAKGLEAVVQF